MRPKALIARIDFGGDRNGKPSSKLIPPVVAYSCSHFIDYWPLFDISTPPYSVGSVIFIYEWNCWVGSQWEVSGAARVPLAASERFPSRLGPMGLVDSIKSTCGFGLIYCSGFHADDEGGCSGGCFRAV